MNLSARKPLVARSQKLRLRPPASEGLSLPSLDKVLKQIKDSGCNKSPIVTELIRCLPIDPNDIDLRDLIAFETLDGLIERETNPFVSNAPQLGDFPGKADLVLGQVPESGCVWTYSYDAPVLCHIFGAGASGFGKTTWALLQAVQILRREQSAFYKDIVNSLIPYRPFDTAICGKSTVTLMALEQKPALRYLLPWFQNLYCFCPHTFRYNPWQPIPGVKDHLRVVESRLEVLCAELEIHAPTRMLLLDVTLKEFEQRGTLVGSGNFPSLRDILNRLIGMHFNALSRDRRSQESAVMRLRGLSDSLPVMFDVSQGFSIDVLDEINFALELTNVATDIRRIVFSWLLNDLYIYRESKQLRGTLA